MKRNENNHRFLFLFGNMRKENRRHRTDIFLNASNNLFPVTQIMYEDFLCILHMKSLCNFQGNNWNKKNKKRKNISSPTSDACIYAEALTA